MSLKKDVLSGIKWTTTSTVIVTILQTAQMIILARLLTPSDFGLMAILMIIIGFSQAFMDMGISSAIIQRQNITNTQLSSLYWLNIFSGIILTTALILLSPVLSLIYNDSKIEFLLILLSPIFIIGSIGNQYRVLCQKALQFKLISMVEITSTFISFILALYLAYTGWGIYALIYAMLTQTLVSNLLFLNFGLRHHHIPLLIYKHNELKGFYSFGFFQMGEKSINYISANLDKLLISAMIGLQAVGFYNMAWQLIIFPLSKINPIVNKIAFPVYSKIQHDQSSINKYYILSIKILSLIAIPISVFLMFYSTDIVLILFGEQWIRVSVIVTILACVGTMKVIGNPGGALILSLGYANVGFWWNLFWAISIFITLYITLIYFPTIEAAAFSILGLSATIGMIWHILIAKIGKIHYTSIVLFLSKITVVSIIIALTSHQVLFLLNIAKPIFKVLLAITICSILYLPYLLLMEKPLIDKLKKD